MKKFELINNKTKFFRLDEEMFFCNDVLITKEDYDKILYENINDSHLFRLTRNNTLINLKTNNEEKFNKDQKFTKVFSVIKE